MAIFSAAKLQFYINIWKKAGSMRIFSTLEFFDKLCNRHSLKFPLHLYISRIHELLETFLRLGLKVQRGDRNQPVSYELLRASHALSVCTFEVYRTACVSAARDQSRSGLIRASKLIDASSRELEHVTHGREQIGVECNKRA